MNDEQRNYVEAEHNLDETRDTFVREASSPTITHDAQPSAESTKIYTARALMIVPSVIMILAGLAVLYISAIKQYAPDDIGMWSRLGDSILVWPIFLSSVAIAIPCMIFGLVLLSMPRKVTSMSAAGETAAVPKSKHFGPGWLVIVGVICMLLGALIFDALGALGILFVLLLFATGASMTLIGVLRLTKAILKKN